MFSNYYEGPNGAMGGAVLDFGQNPTDTASVVITGQPGITLASKLQAFFMSEATADNGTDEHEEGSALCQLVCGSIIPGVGFTVYAHTLAMLGIGQFNIQWNWC